MKNLRQPGRASLAFAMAHAEAEKPSKIMTRKEKETVANPEPNRAQRRAMEHTAMTVPITDGKGNRINKIKGDLNRGKHTKQRTRGGILAAQAQKKIEEANRPAKGGKKAVVHAS